VWKPFSIISLASGNMAFLKARPELVSGDYRAV